MRRRAPEELPAAARWMVTIFRQFGAPCFGVSKNTNVRPSAQTKGSLGEPGADKGRREGASINRKWIFDSLVPGHDDLTPESVVGWRGAEDALLMFLARITLEATCTWISYEP